MIPLSYGNIPTASMLHPRAHAAGKGTSSVLADLRKHLKSGDMGAAEKLLNELGFCWVGSAPSIEEDIAAVADALGGES